MDQDRTQERLFSLPFYLISKMILIIQITFLFSLTGVVGV